MAGLTGSTIATSYDQLLISDNASGGNGASLVAIKDGDGGTTFCISITDASTGKAVLAVDGSHASGTEVQIDNSAGDGDAFLSFQLSGTSLFTMGVDDGDSDVFKIGTTAIGTGTMFALDTSSRISLSNNDSGTSNTILGKLAGNAIESGGTYNIAIGENALSTETTGDYNVAVGYNALQDLNYDGTGGNTGLGNFAGANITTGTANTAVGHNPLGTATTALKNTALGYAAMADVKAGVAVDGCIAIGHAALIGNSSNTTGINGTVAIGTSALTALTTGGANIAIGYTALQGHTTGHSNTAIGYEAMSDTDAATVLDSDYNTAIGAYSMNGAWTNAVSEHNVAVGAQTMAGAMNGALRNTAVGYKSMNSLVSADFNTALGYESLLDMTDGERNVALGYGAAENTVSGTHNTALGMGALGTTTNALIGTVAVGYNAMGSGAVTTGANYTVAVGRDALAALTDGAGNTAVGYKALAATTTGQYNTVMGYQAADALPAGAQSNTAIGYNALGAGNNASCDSNTVMGEGACGSLTTGSQNTCIGAGSDPSAVGAVNQTCIGYGANGIADNTVTLGNDEVTAVYMSHDGDAVVSCGGLGVGLGTTAPTSPATVHFQNGTYAAVGASPVPLFECRTSVNEVVMGVRSSNSSYTSYQIAMAVAKAGNSNFGYITCSNGSSSDAGLNNAFQVDGDGEVNAENTTINGIDYAEYFESMDGEVIAVGKTVKLDNGKIVTCSEGETPIGVIRPKSAGASSIVGGAHWNNWQGKFLRDEYGGLILAEDGGQQLNPEYDVSLSESYSMREDRDEWHIVGLLGQIPITKGQPTGNWIKMKDISDTVEMYFVK